MNRSAKHTNEKTKGLLMQDFLEKLLSSLLKDRMDTLVRKRSTFQVDEPNKKSKKAHQMQRAKVNRTGQFTEGLKSQEDSWGTDGDGCRDMSQASQKGNNLMKMIRKEDEPDYCEKAEHGRKTTGFGSHGDEGSKSRYRSLAVTLRNLPKLYFSINTGEITPTS